MCLPRHLLTAFRYFGLPCNIAVLPICNSNLCCAQWSHLVKASRACQPHTRPMRDNHTGWSLIFADPKSCSHAQKSRPLLRLAAQKILSDMTRFVRTAKGRIAESVSLFWRRKRKESCDLFSRCFEYVAY